MRAPGRGGRRRRAIYLYYLGRRGKVAIVDTLAIWWFVVSGFLCEDIKGLPMFWMTVDGLKAR